MAEQDLPLKEQLVLLLQSYGKALASGDALLVDFATKNLNSFLLRVDLVEKESDD